SSFAPDGLTVNFTFRTPGAPAAGAAEGVATAVAPTLGAFTAALGPAARGPAAESCGSAKVMAVPRGAEVERAVGGAIGAAGSAGAPGARARAALPLMARAPPNAAQPRATEPARIAATRRIKSLR